MLRGSPPPPFFFRARRPCPQLTQLTQRLLPWCNNSVTSPSSRHTQVTPTALELQHKITSRDGVPLTHSFIQQSTVSHLQTSLHKFLLKSLSLLAGVLLFSSRLPTPRCHHTTPSTRVLSTIPSPFSSKPLSCTCFFILVAEFPSHSHPNTPSKKKKKSSLPLPFPTRFTSLVLLGHPIGRAV